MRGRRDPQATMLAFVDMEERVSKDHPIRSIKAVADDALERLRNETHESRTDAESRLMRKGKGKEAKLVFIGHALMENRNRLVMDFVVNGATGTAQCAAVPVLVDGARERGFRPRTPGGDKGYDTLGYVKDMRDRGVTPHVAQRVHSAIDGWTTRHSGYKASQKVRKRVESIFGWMKTVGGFRQTRYRGVGAYWLGGILGGCGLQLGADDESDVESGDPGGSVSVSCPGAECVQHALTRLQIPTNPPLNRPSGRQM